MSSSGREIIVIGGGLAGLTCALMLQKGGQKIQLIEASERIGGRVKTDQIDGFLLDRGFQVFQSSYPTAAKWLDLKSLNLRAFRNGCLLRKDDSFKVVADPWRNPLDSLRSIFAPTGKLSDFSKVARFRQRVRSEKDPYVLLESPQTTAIERLHQCGFSTEIIEDFFKPFYSGVFLEKELTTSSRMLDFTFSMFSRGEATLPADGMEAIPRQLAKQLHPGTIRTQTTVSEIRDGLVKLDDGSSLSCAAIVVATEMPAAARLLQADSSYTYRSTRCVYFDAGNAPVESPSIVLNCDMNSIVNSLCCPSRVQPSYAPENRTLVSVTSIGPLDRSPHDHVEAVRDELREWFGSDVDRWRPLSTYNIPYSLPDQSVANMEQIVKTPRVTDTIYRCGDYCDTRSIDGAIRSGERAAAAVLADFKSAGS